MPTPQPQPLFALRLPGGPADVRTAMAVGEHADLVSSRWRIVAQAGGPGVLLVSEGASPRVAGLAQAGADVVRVAKLSPRACEFADASGAVTRWGGPSVRTAPSLLAALPPTRGPEEAPEEALFVGPGVDALARSLAAAGRVDFSTGTLGGAPALLLPRPSLHALLAAAEGPRARLVAYGPSGARDVWVEWPWRSRVAGALAAPARASGSVALGAPKGAWSFAPLSVRPFGSALEGALAAWRPPPPDTAAAPGPGTQFRVRISLRDAPAGSAAEPSAWLLDADGLERAAGLAERLPPEDVARLSVTRLAGPRGVTFFLREVRAGGKAPIAPLVAAAVGHPGYATAPGADGLYLPAGRAIHPPMRRDSVRDAFLGDGRGSAVIVEGAGGAAEVVHVPPAESVPLTALIDYRGPDRREEIERLDETPVFDWPELRVAAGSRSDATGQRAPAAPPPRPRWGSLPPAPAAPKAPEPPAPPPAPPPAADAAALREARALEEALVAPGRTDAAAWERLGDLKVALGDRDEATRAYESALFLAPSAALAAKLVSALSPGNRRQVRADAFVGPAGDLATATALLAALEGREDPRAFAFALSGALAPGPGEPDVAAPRKLAWAAALAVCRASRDRLGLVRARERLFGSVNVSGLSEARDMPRFVRLTMAAPGVGAANAPQIEALARVFAAAGEHASASSTSSTAGYIRAIFALGFDRLGDVARAREAREGIPSGRARAWAANPVNVALFEAYRLRAGFVSAGAAPDPARWALEVSGLVRGLGKAVHVDQFNWVLNHSAWLATAPRPSINPRARPEFQQEVEAMADLRERPGEVVAALQAVLAKPGIFGFETRMAIEAALAAVLASGNAQAIAGALDVAIARLVARGTIGAALSPIHLGGALAACVRTAAAIDDRRSFTRLVGELTSLVRPAGPGAAPVAPRDLGQAVESVLAVARRAPELGRELGEFEAALAEAVGRAEAARAREIALIRAPHVELLRLRNDARAAPLLTASIDAALDPAYSPQEPVVAYDALARFVRVTRRWPVASRVPWCEAVVRNIDRVRDPSSGAALGIYNTYHVKLLEAVVDALSDDQTYRTDQIAAWLGDEELFFRRRVRADEGAFAA